jgi:hypothetical protein
VELGRGLLDNQVIDRAGKRIGKVDGVVLTAAPGRPPAVSAIELGAPVVAHRIHPRLGRWLTRLVRRRRLPFGRTRIPWRRVVSVDREVRVALDGERTRAHAFERWLRTHVIARIPGSG